MIDRAFEADQTGSNFGMDAGMTTYSSTENRLLVVSLVPQRFYILTDLPVK